MNSRSQYILRTINKKSNQTSESLKGALIIPMEDYHISIIMDDKFKGKRSKAIQTAAHSMAKQGLDHRLGQASQNPHLPSENLEPSQSVANSEGQAGPSSGRNDDQGPPTRLWLHLKSLPCRSL